MPRGRPAGMPASPADGLDEAPSSPEVKNRVVRAIIRGFRKSRRSGMSRKKKKMMGSYRAPKGPGRGQQHQPPQQQQEKRDGPAGRAKSDPQKPSTGRPPVGHVLILRDRFDASIHPSRLAVCEGSVAGQIFVGWIGVSDEAKRSGQVDKTLLSAFHEHGPSEAEAEMMILPALLSAQDRSALGYADEDDDEDDDEDGEDDEDNSYGTEDNADSEKDSEKEEHGKEQAKEEHAKEREKTKNEKKREKKSEAG